MIHTRTRCGAHRDQECPTPVVENCLYSYFRSSGTIPKSDMSGLFVMIKRIPRCGVTPKHEVAFLACP
jgi:hypothetical protein